MQIMFVELVLSKKLLIEYFEGFLKFKKSPSLIDLININLLFAVLTANKK
jgi:hypothetical protein